ncbi:hypothetical protein FISHEDRAFT_73174 [Fistulina hepatica ATCC 64428]|uniref:Uncharacterized protein n=1 Tax=Fistulina hepatica ATCC 64428 TaxID=1128425 RepID=A0A0D7AGA7_9AGAR|nr:hypothetical protein FISHEDRAFT_73174 [Fistulina hepatica ATCC 64428]
MATANPYRANLLQNRRDYDDESGHRKTPHQNSPLARNSAAMSEDQTTAGPQPQHVTSQQTELTAGTAGQNDGRPLQGNAGQNNSQQQDADANMASGSLMEVTKDLPAFEFPDPMDQSTQPALREENPHLQKSQRWPAPTTTPANWTTPFTQAIWPHAVFPMESLLRNVSDKHWEDIHNDQVETLLAVCFDTGPANNAKYPDQVKNLLNVLETLKEDLEKMHEGEAGYTAVDGTIDAELAEPKRKSEGDKEMRPFNSPWIVILKIAHAKVWNFLVHRQTLAWDRALTAHFITLDPSVKSWVIMHLQCNAVRGTDAAKARLLGSIKGILWQDKVYHKIVDIITSPLAEFEGSLDECVFESTKTFDLVYVSYAVKSGEKEGKLIKLYILMGKPLMNDPDLHKRWIEAIRKANLRVGIQTIRTKEVYTICDWCKLPMHPTEGCEYLTFNDWYGLRQQDNPMRGQPSTRGGQSTGRRQGGTSGRGPRGGSWGNRFNSLEM